ncbi:prolyl oligopeptidase family serine peptidase [Rhizobium sp. CNPSo 4039]|uniref:prolyl oligopeptidase family serine peptidase n=1 Tax=Rhizobium sp. CNPSo 4039 TaxID=3021409 RepID=UPI00254F44D6|nr:prolyl oligopeptidase family serine peptidase [Rhizobium sp. CNPSo 4039]MDK4716016.1 prolyl oligopeptidase family serine peptidase [Rhizobium sp. CNPSo 4039]
MKKSTAIAVSLFMQINSVSAQTLESDVSEIQYPKTERVDVTEKRFGVTVADPYRWLEDTQGKGGAVGAWVEAQNKVTRRYLDALPGRDILKQRMKALFDYERYTVPRKRSDNYFFTFNKGLENQPALYVRDGALGQARLLIDPNTWSDDNADAIGEWSVSDDGRHLAFSVQKGGTDWRTIRVIDVESGNELQDVLEWARFSNISWAPDNSGFFYSRMPEPAQGASGAAIANHAVYFHRLGTPQAEDRLIYSTPDQPGLLHVANRAEAGRYLAISSTPGTNENALTIVDLAAGDWRPRKIVPQMEAEWSVIGNDGSRVFLITTAGAERRRVVSLDLAEADPHVVEIVAEDADNAVLNDAAVMGNTLFIAYLVDAKTEIRRFSMSGTPEGMITLPGIGTAGGFQGRPGASEAFFSFTAFDAPTAVYRYDTETNAVKPWAEPKASIKPDDIVVEQRFYRSKDWTEVPIFIVRRKDVTIAAPTLLYGYGGFGIPQVPYYNPIHLAWVEQGGVLAIAGIRGGGEYGRAWHRAGQLEKKQNSFDDFIAAGEFLKKSGIASSDGLAIQGESNGGLLVAAVTNQRPDLFDVALPGVGVMDMLRFNKFTAGGFWINEFGDPSQEQPFRNLLSYSPYHTIKQGEDYPAILATTADADDRVVPAHTYKYIAALQAAELGSKPRLVRIETRAGHGAGMPLDKVIAQHADMWAFAARWTGLEIKHVKQTPSIGE